LVLGEEFFKFFFVFVVEHFEFHAEGVPDIVEERKIYLYGEIVNDFFFLELFYAVAYGVGADTDLFSYFIGGCSCVLCEYF